MMRAIALYDCTADHVEELSFKEGDVLVDVTKSAEDGWYEGRIEGTSIRGLFPYNYVEFVKDPPPKSKPIPRRTTITPDLSQQKTHNSMSVTPPNLSLSPTWSVISTKESHDDNASSPPVKMRSSSSAEKPPKSKDAFEIAMMHSPFSHKSNSNSQKVKPSVAPKPAQLSKDAIKQPLTDKPVVVAPLSIHKQGSIVASRVRSLSASAAATHNGTPRPLDFKHPVGASNGLAAKDLPIIRPKPTLNQATISTPLQPRKREPERALFDLIDEETEDADGFQLVKPSLLRQRQQKPATPPSTHEKLPSKLADIPAANNPAPRLPSRPSRPRSSNNNTKKTELQPKPVVNQTTVAPVNAPSPPPTPSRARSKSSGPPPVLAPKPMLPARPSPPPPLSTSNKPITPVLPPRPTTGNNDDSNIKPSELLNRGRSKSEGWQALPHYQQQKQSRPVPSIPVSQDAVAKKTPPPPPPSRSKQLSPNRYEALFNSINDDGFVDGETVRVLWKRSRLPDDVLAQIWEQCDPKATGLLDKDRFIKGLRAIDSLLEQKLTK